MAIYGTLGGQDSTSTGYPSIRPTLDLNFAQTKTLDPRVTFYRDSLATYTDSLGIVRTVPANVPRFDHDPTTGESLGLLIEESRTNLLTYSEDFSNGIWTKSNTTVSINTTVSPNESLTADAITASSGSGYKDLYQTFTSSAATNTTYTFSVFVKANGITFFTVVPYFNGVSYASWFNLSTGTPLTNTSGNTSTITNYGNGWYRCTVTRTSPATLSSAIFIVRPADANGNETYTGNGSNGFYVWGAQVEVGSFATSYIPTSATTVTRSADVAYFDGTNFSSWFNQSEGSIYFDATIRGDGEGSNIYYGEIGEFASSNNRNIFFTTPEGSRGRYIYITSGTTVVSLTATGTTLTYNQKNNVCYGYKLNDFAVAIDNSVFTDTSGTLHQANSFTLGSNNLSPRGEYLNGTIARIMYYPKRLTNSQLRNLTAL
jgi:hypothetical protein